ncbi:MAG: DNA repair protein RecN [bacterium]|nr:DNA repair protein RecN [bacterium]
MLEKIYIKNYILIEELELEPSKGLNIITGETGAGKSILISAIDVAFGAKIGKEVIGRYDDKAVIELTLLNTKHDINALFEKYGIDNNGNEIILTREISQNVSRSKINGCMINQEFLKIFREMFLDIHSQHQTYSLLQPKYHIELLDSYIKSATLNEYKGKYKVYKELCAELSAAQNSSQKTEDQIEFLKFQINEIQSANIIAINEDNDLSNELAVLENSEKLKELTGSSYWTIYGDDSSITGALYEVKSLLSKAAGLDTSLASSEEEFADIIDRLKTLSSTLRDYSSSMENNSARIDEIQERLFILDKLKHKYGGTLEKVIQTGNELQTELDSIEFSTQNIELLQTKINFHKEELTRLAGMISSERKKQSEILSALIVEKLEKLELPKVRFEIGIEQTELSQNGYDKVEFLISTNVSEALKPIAKVASGGEISRIMLAIKSIFAQADSVDTIIFDEIDTGISGKTSQAVADEVKELAKYMQIIMITHQAIIASKADKHLYVKKTQGEQTSVRIYNLEGENRLKGLAELASGNITDESLNFAKNLIVQ